MKIRSKASCGCGSAPNVVVCCSGASDTAEIGDRAARLLSREGSAKMSCLAGVGGGVDTILSNIKKSLLIVAIDGCDTDCSKKVMEQAGFTDFIHIRVTDLGMVKGESQVTEENIQKVASQARSALGIATVSA